MHVPLPDFGDLVFSIAVLFGTLIVIFETLERRREGARERRLLAEIDREYAHYRSLGHFEL